MSRPDFSRNKKPYEVCHTAGDPMNFNPRLIGFFCLPAPSSQRRYVGTRQGPAHSSFGQQCCPEWECSSGTRAYEHQQQARCLEFALQRDTEGLDCAYFPSNNITHIPSYIQPIPFKKFHQQSIFGQIGTLTREPHIKVRIHL